MTDSPTPVDDVYAPDVTIPTEADDAAAVADDDLDTWKVQVVDDAVVVADDDLDADAVLAALTHIATSAEAVAASMISMIRYQEAILEVLMEIRNGQ